ncbi:DsbA family protein [Rhodovulum sp. DZ06]|uniref:DsbA family protein n=1 Tax=Rhodovulum sp. DZ06 TaxID=3425126 RepID=UPI003D3252C8
MSWSRRDALSFGGGALLLGVAGGAALYGRGNPAMQFRPHSRLPGYRALVQGGTGGGAALVGVGGGGGGAQPVAPGPDALCAALFDPVPGKVPVAMFTDHRCAVCKAVEADLFARAAGPDARIALRVHNWPALGGVSVPLAHAGEAARAQGPEAWRAMHDVLMTLRGRPSDARLAKMAGDAGLDGDRLVADMRAPRTVAALAQSADLAWLFGFIGTPGLVFGRTSAVGALPPAVLEAILEDAAESGPPPGCFA